MLSTQIQTHGTKFRHMVQTRKLRLKYQHMYVQLRTQWSTYLKDLELGSKRNTCVAILINKNIFFSFNNWRIEGWNRSCLRGLVPVGEERV
jgi:hypothetical protein